jgi:Deoxyribonuclease NucA/NucB
MDPDEYPPAVAREGGEGASVWYVESGENRSAGAAMGARLEPWCNGRSFRLVVRR